VNIFERMDAIAVTGPRGRGERRRQLFIELEKRKPDKRVGFERRKSREGQKLCLGLWNLNKEKKRERGHRIAAKGWRKSRDSGERGKSFVNVF